MRVENHTRGCWPLLLVCLALTGCASTGAPDGWLPVAEEAQRDPYGSWVTVEFQKEIQEGFLRGEFLAVDDDSLYVLTPYSGSGDPVRGVPLGDIKKAKIASFDPETGKGVGWVVMGSVASLSHGVGAAISIPLWMVMGGSMAAGQSRLPLENYPQLPWIDLKMFARFPQGPPPHIHQLDLQPKNLYDAPATAEPEPAENPF
jgi:hypothetical protein